MSMETNIETVGCIKSCKKGRGFILAFTYTAREKYAMM